jgi:hypothetical protein
LGDFLHAKVWLIGAMQLISLPSPHLTSPHLTSPHLIMSLFSNNANYFDSVISLVPQTYLHPHAPLNNKFAKHTKSQSQSQKVKQNNNKHANSSNEKNNKPNKNPKLQPTEEEEDPSEELSASSDEEQSASVQLAAKSSSLNNDSRGAAQQHLNLQPSSLTLNELKAKFDAKLATLKQKRKAEPTKREEIQQKRAKNKEIQKKKQFLANNSNNQGQNQMKPRKDEEEAQSEEEASNVVGNNPRSRPIIQQRITESNDFMFSDLASGSGAGSVNTGGKTKSHALQLKNRLAKKKVSKQQLLGKIVEFEGKISEIAAQDKTKADEILHAKSLNSALLKAQGITVKDNAKLLKKSIKKDAAKRKKSAKVWAERAAETKEGMKERAMKRDQNVADRSKQRVQAKLNPFKNKTTSSRKSK